MYKTYTNSSQIKYQQGEGKEDAKFPPLTKYLFAIDSCEAEENPLGFFFQ